MENWTWDNVCIARDIGMKFKRAMECNCKVYLTGGALLRPDSPDIDILIVTESLRHTADYIRTAVRKEINFSVFDGLEIAFDIDGCYGCDTDAGQRYDYIFKTTYRGKKIDILVWDMERLNDERDMNQQGSLWSAQELVQEYYPFSIQHILYDIEDHKLWKGDNWSDKEIYVRKGIYRDMACSTKYMKYYPYARFHFDSPGITGRPIF